MKRALLITTVIFFTLMTVSGGAYARVRFGEDVTVPLGTEVKDAVSAGGNVKIMGTVRKNAVSFGGDVIIEPAGVVKGDIVSFGGNIIVKSGATVKGNVTSIGGWNDIDPGATVGGEVKSIEDIVFPDRIVPYIVHPLSHGVPGIFKVLFMGPFAGLFGLAGIIFGLIILAFKLVISGAIAVVITYLFPDHVSRVAEYIHNDFPKAMFIGFVFTIVLPIITLLLIVTLIGIPIVPLFLISVVVAYLFGAVGIALWIGRIVPESETRSLMMNVLLGVVIVSVLKQLPIFGFVASILFWSAAVGSVIVTRFGKYTR